MTDTWVRLSESDRERLRFIGRVLNGEKERALIRSLLTQQPTSSVLVELERLCDKWEERDESSVPGYGVLRETREVARRACAEELRTLTRSLLDPDHTTTGEERA